LPKAQPAATRPTASTKPSLAAAVTPTSDDDSINPLVLAVVALIAFLLASINLVHLLFRTGGSWRKA
jgi:hypothetical protein